MMSGQVHPMSHADRLARRSPRSDDSRASTWSRLLLPLGLFLSLLVSATVHVNEPDDPHGAEAAATARHLFRICHASAGSCPA